VGEAHTKFFSSLVSIDSLLDCFQKKTVRVRVFIVHRMLLFHKIKEDLISHDMTPLKHICNI